MSSTFPRFESPGQLALAAVAIWLIGAIFHPLAVLAPIGVALLLAAGVAYLLRPKNRSMYWRGRRIDLDDGRSAGANVYHLFFRR
jgi:cbb3-type cytochrome oxidase subunit 3